MAVEARHGGHHHDNEKYGYVLFVIALAHLAVIAGGRALHSRLWRLKGSVRTPFRAVVAVPVWLSVGVWVVVLGALLQHHVTKELLTVGVKRAGRFAYVLLPFDMVLALKPLPLPQTTYLDTMALHRWMLRLIALLGVVHGVGFLVIWLARANGDVWKVFHVLNFLGVVMLVAFVGLVVVLVRVLRHRRYRLFYVVHQATLLVVVVFGYWHARPGVLPYAVVCMGLLGYLVVCKFQYSGDVILEEDDIVGAPGLQLVLVRLHRLYIKNPAAPAAHLRLNEAGLGLVLAWVAPLHPYTIASESLDGYAHLVVKQTRFSLRPGVYSVFAPPFRLLVLWQHPETLQLVRSCVVVCGGLGISYALPAFHALVSTGTQAVKLVWTVRSRADVFVLDQLGIRGQVDVYVAGGSGSGGEALSLLVGDATEEYELDEMAGPKPEVEEHANYRVIAGRLDVRALLTEFNQQLGDLGDRWVVASGPALLVAECRAVAAEMGLNFESEAYEM